MTYLSDELSDSYSILSKGSAERLLHRVEGSLESTAMKVISTKRWS